jgi:hypothetical protein
MNKIKHRLDPNSVSYAVSMLLLAALSCAGTWIVPFVVSFAAQKFFGVNLQPSSPQISQGNDLLDLIVDIVWMITFVIVSLSTWWLVITFALIVDRVFDLHLINRFVSKDRVSRYLVVAAGIYVMVGILARVNSNPSLFSVFRILEYQAAGIFIGSGIGGIISPLAVASASNKTRLIKNREPTDEERAQWALTFPLFFGCVLGGPLGVLIIPYLIIP